MKKLLQLRKMLLLCALIVGSGSAWADDEPSVTLDFTSQENWDIPTSGSSNKELATFTDGTYSIKLYSTTNYKLNNGYLILGKTGSYLEFPAFSFNVSKIVVTGTSSASEKVKQNIYVGDVPVSEETEGAKDVSNEYEIDEAYQTAGNVYKLMVTSNHNTQISKIEIYEAATSSTNPTAALSATSLDFGEVIFGQTKEMTFNVTPANLTSDLTISCDNDKYEVTPTTIASTATGAQTITVTAMPTANDDDMDGTITISGGGLAESKTVTLSTTVKSREGVEPFGPSLSAGYYVLVTDASSLADGDQIIIAYVSESAHYSMSTASDKNNRPALEVTVNDNGTIAASDDIQVITLEGDADGWYFNVGTDAYLYAASSSSNHLKTASYSTAGDNGKATISIEEDGTATIKFQGSNTRKWLKYNPNGNSPLFACYADDSSTGSEPQIYRYVAGTPTNEVTVTLSAYGYKTLVATENFTVTGATAYIVTAANETNGATMTSVEVVPANEPVILKGNANAEVTLTFTDDDASDVTDNLLAISNAAINYNGAYVLAVKNEEAGFYKWAGGSLGAGRVYLPADNVTTSGAREYLPFSFDDATGITESAQFTVQSSQPAYNLNGQRVVSPKSGLYIVNGKKVMMK